MATVVFHVRCGLMSWPHCDVSHRKRTVVYAMRGTELRRARSARSVSLLHLCTCISVKEATAEHRAAVYSVTRSYTLFITSLFAA